MKKLLFSKPYKSVKIKKKKRSKSSLKKKLDQLFSQHIRSIGHCQAMNVIECRCGGNLQCAHLITRWNLRLRWDENNAIALCAGHHRFFTHRPLEWAKFIRQKFNKKYCYVMTHKNEIKKMKESDYLIMIEAYKQRLEFFI